ncbi:NAD-dependent epimerase/dehydratase family protein [Bacillus sp. FJAT-42376]|uniref:NAD-dependent epimerase/dehydratase family protein n=1 Tax=Bacillus sp. FJAT-42376 TaxID=2014076 RepID=UPI000F510E81|nr:NAD-dependent epimerase/dehydratase family protein [Bacillus sp. FJAT-42376]AZB42436.1 NAD-dependent epimerase/dehydratase family protein [Bacillus sp. FJAT-42376]
MRNILVLGGTSYFGKKLVQKLIENGDRVTIATRGNQAGNFGGRAAHLKIERGDRASMNKAFEGKEWDLLYDQSCLASREALDAAEALKDKTSRYIFTSTQAVYDFGTNHREESFDPIAFPFTLKKRGEYQGYEGYQEAKRASEAIFFQKDYFHTAAVRMPIVVSEDDYTERLKFHVERVSNSQPVGIPHPEFRYSFIQADEAADFLFRLGKSDFTGPINPGCKEDISLAELMEKIGEIAEKPPLIEQAVTKENASPYALPGSWSIDTGMAENLGYRFSALDDVLDPLIRYWNK